LEAKANYPALKADTPLRRLFNREMKWACDSMFHEAVFSQTGSTMVFSLKGVLSVENERIVCGLISVERTGLPTELFPITYWLNGSQPARAVWGNLVNTGSSADEFAKTLLLPVLNESRKSNGLAALAEFPPGLLDGFVVTKSNLSWIVPPGVAGRDAVQIKVSHDLVKPWADGKGPLGYLWPVSAAKISFGLFVKWPIRDDVPPGGTLQISLFRDRDDRTALGVQSFPVKDPPMEVRCEFTGIVADPDERLYVDVRVINNGQTYFRNREAARMPAQGWQTVREIRLDRER